MLVESLELQRELLGAEHPRVAVTETELGRVLLSTGRYSDAADIAATARESLAAALSDDHWRTAWAGVIEGASRARLDDFGAAEELLLPGLEIIEADPAAGDLRKDTTLRFIAHMYDEWGKPDRAAFYLAMVSGRGSN